VYTNEGHRLDGVWRRFGESRRGVSLPWRPFGSYRTHDGTRVWEKGTCITEFNRSCEWGPPPVDLQSGLEGVFVQVDSSFFFQLLLSPSP